MHVMDGEVYTKGNKLNSEERKDQGGKSCRSRMIPFPNKFTRSLTLKSATDFLVHERVLIVD
ncbi:hypothetical protein K7432_015447 [Basidiobolus ranarum]|uniref:Uncharacterized protein n=1 Tax=Basidiobolus ranarum TaxID=34480 RepID=A0ABR2WG54_9FUNG